MDVGDCVGDSLLIIQLDAMPLVEYWRFVDTSLQRHRHLGIDSTR